MKFHMDGEWPKILNYIEAKWQINNKIYVIYNNLSILGRCQYILKDYNFQESLRARFSQVCLVHMFCWFSKGHIILLSIVLRKAHVF